MSSDIQNGLIETIQRIAGERLKNLNFTKSYTGIVKEKYGQRCVVEIFDSQYECIIPHNLANFININDIVIVQDIVNNRIKRIIQGVISSLNKDIFHIYDPIENKIVSSLLQLWDEELQIALDVVFEIE